MSNTFIAEFIRECIHRVAENTPRILACLNELDETEVWKAPNENSNSIGNMMVHLSGNIRQYILATLHGSPDTRHRAEEFSIKAGKSKSQLLNLLTGTISEAIYVIKSLDESRLMKMYLVQGYTLSGIGIIIHVTEHYSYHTGQIVFWTKQIKNRDMGFYAHLNPV